MPLARKKHAMRKKLRISHSPKGNVRVAADLQPKLYFRWSEVVQRVMAAILLIPAFPLIGLLTLMVRLHSRGPGIYRQSRMGKNAQVFTMYKIRTMRSDAESGTGPVWTKPQDPRITGLGRFLRKLHLDELPQLLNVIRGEMALIGPRPERPEIVAVLAKKIPGYTDRLIVLPGVTGLAQINLPPDNTLDDVRRKLALDMEYIHSAGPWLDLRILLSTLFRLLGLPGTLAMQFFKLSRPRPRIDGHHGDTANGNAPAHHNRRRRVATNMHSDTIQKPR